MTTLATIDVDEDQRRGWQSAIDHYAAALPPGTVRHFALTPLDHTSIACHVVSFAGDDGTLRDGIGYGVCPEEAICGAHGELAETLSVAAALRRVRSVDETSYSSMVDRFGEHGVVDPPLLCLTPGSDYDPERPIDWIEMRRVADEQPVYVPREFAAYARTDLRHCDPLITPITNGLGAGPSIEHAVEHGLCELLQRDGNCTTFRAMDRGIVVDLDRSQIGDELSSLLDHVESLGIELMVKLASTEFGLCNVYAVGFDREREPSFSLQATACGEASHPDREIAIRKCVLEFLAARARKTFMHGPLDAIAAIAPPGYLETYRERFDLRTQEPRALREMIRWVQKTPQQLLDGLASSVYSRRSEVAIEDLPTTGSGMAVSGAAERLRDIRGRLDEEQIDALYLDMSTDRDRDNGVHIARVVAPGLECETMSYGRIGERGLRRSLSLGHPFVRNEPVTDDQPASAELSENQSWLRPVLTPRQREQLGDSFRVNLRCIDEIVGGAYPLYREPNAHAVQIAVESDAVEDFV